MHLFCWLAGWAYLNFGAGDITVGYFQTGSGEFLLPSVYGTLINMLLVYGNTLWLLPGFGLRSIRYYGYLLLLFMGLSLLETGFDYAVIVSLFEWSAPGFWEELFTDNALFHLLFFLLPSYGLWFWHRFRKSEEDQKLLREEKLQAELLLLRQQVNPHFLFNILNNLYASSLQAQDDRTAEGIGQLADMMRYMLYESGGDRVPLAGEIRYIEDYIALQRLRFASEDQVMISFEYDVPEAATLSIPPMLLIPFVENAFKHGISLENASFIELSLRAGVDGQLSFECRNSLHRQEAGKEPAGAIASGGIGLENVRRRLALLYPDGHFLDAGRASEGEAAYVVHLEIEKL